MKTIKRKIIFIITKKKRKKRKEIKLYSNDKRKGKNLRKLRKERNNERMV